jgi:hypothetical protein
MIGVPLDEIMAELFLARSQRGFWYGLRAVDLLFGDEQIGQAQPGMKAFPATFERGGLKFARGACNPLFRPHHDHWALSIVLAVVACIAMKLNRE